MVEFENDDEAEYYDNEETELVDPPEDLPPVGECCPLCQGVKHEGTAEAKYGLTCPGIEAEEEVKAAFREELAWRESIAENMSEEMANDPEAARLLKARQAAATSRFSAETVAELNAARPPMAQRISHATAMTNAIRRDGIREARVEAVEFEVDPPHLTVPGEVPEPSTTGFTPGSMFHRNLTQPDDVQLYIGDTDD